MSKVILASSSPRRRELLDKAEIKYSLCIKSVDEKIPVGMSADEAVEYLALLKAEAVSQVNDEAVVIGADTVVVLDGEILGKPANEEEAINMLLSLSGREHKVITGVALVRGKRHKAFHVTTKVKFYDIGYSEAVHYVKSGEPMDKAGAYGIQGKGGIFIEKIDGDYYNVVGLPIARLVRELRVFQGEGE